MGWGGVGVGWDRPQRRLPTAGGGRWEAGGGVGFEGRRAVGLVAEADGADLEDARDAVLRRGAGGGRRALLGPGDLRGWGARNLLSAEAARQPTPVPDPLRPIEGGEGQAAGRRCGARVRI